MFCLLAFSALAMHQQGATELSAMELTANVAW